MKWKNRFVKKFKLGAKVRIKEDSEFSYQSSDVGEIINIDSYTSYKYRVEFPCYTNVYRKKDLELV